MTFRVSAEEHSALTKSCLNSGARSIADFARAAVLQRVQMSSTPAVDLPGDLATLSKRLQDLDVTLMSMRKRIRAVLGPVSSRLGTGIDEASGIRERNEASTGGI